MAVLAVDTFRQAVEGAYANYKLPFAPFTNPNRISLYAFAQQVAAALTTFQQNATPDDLCANNRDIP